MSVGLRDGRCTGVSKGCRSKRSPSFVKVVWRGAAGSSRRALSFALGLPSGGRYLPDEASNWGLVLQRTPRPLDEDVVEIAAAAVHGRVSSCRKSAPARPGRGCRRPGRRTPMSNPESNSMPTPGRAKRGAPDPSDIDEQSPDDYQEPQQPGPAQPPCLSELREPYGSSWPNPSSLAPYRLHGRP